MADETRNANVVLSADVQPYSQDIQKAYQDTNRLIDAVNKLATSLDGITKRTGKKIMIFAAADIATATAMVLVTAKYEKQLATLNAQLTISGKNLGIYKKGIDEIARVMPSTREELSRLATQIHELGVQSEREAIKMTRTFTQLAAATGEDVGSLTSGLVELSRQMGTLNNGANGISKFADSLTMVASASGVSATSVLNFAQSISPFARAAGLGQKELLGISAAFTRAGADGYAAANAFNSILADITRQIQTGSPEIQKYSNAVGVTMETFKDMGPAEQLTQIFEAVNKAGPDAIKLLDRMGIDGIRAAKAIQAVSNEQGGLRKAIETASQAYGGGATEKGAAAAFDTFDAKATKLKNNMTQVASSIGEGVMPFAKALLDVLNQMLNVVNQIADPLLKLGGAMMAIMGPVTGAVGALLTLMGPLSTLMMGFMAMRLTPLKAFAQGSGEGVLAKQGLLTPDRMSDIGNRVAIWNKEKLDAAAAGRPADISKRVPWYQAAGYNLGRMAGETRMGVGMSQIAPPSLVGAGTWAARGIGAVASGYREWYQDAALKGDRAFDRRSMAGMLQGPIDRAGGLLGAARTAFTSPGQDGVFKTFRSELEKSNAALKAAAVVTTANTAANTANTTAQAGNTATLSQHIKKQLETAGTLEAFRAALGRATGQLAMIPLSAARFGIRAGAQIAGAGMNLLGSLGGMVGGGAGTGAVMAGGLAAYMFLAKARERNSENIINESTPKNIADINASLGISTEALGDFTDVIKGSYNSLTDFVSVADAMRDAMATATSAIGEYSDRVIENLSSPDQAVGYLQALGTLTPQQAGVAAADINRRFGMMQGSDVVDQYLARTGNGSNPYATGMIGSIMGGAVMTQDQARVGWGPMAALSPFMGLNQAWASPEASKQVETAWGAISEDLTETRKTKSDRFVNQKLAAYINDVFTSTLDEQIGPDGMFAPSKTNIIEQNIRQLEKAFGAEGNFTMYPEGIGKGAGVGLPFQRTDNVFQSTEELMKDLLSQDNQSPLGVAMKEWASQSGITAEDFTKTGSKNLTTMLSKGMTQSEFSPWISGIRSTQLGRWGETTKSITDVTSGDRVSDPASRIRATKDMADQAIRFGKTLAGATEELQRYKQAVGDENDYRYQIASAAQAQVNQRMATQAENFQGPLAGFQARMGRLQSIILNPVNSDAGETEFNEAISGRKAEQQALREGIVGYNQMIFQANIEQERAQEDHDRSLLYMQEDYQQQSLWAQQDFHIQQTYAMEDFNRSMKRAAEDAAKSMYDPFVRPMTRGTISSGMTANNLQQQMKLIKDQVRNLDTLRKRGLSQTAIDNLNLSDPSMASQVQRFVDEGGDFNASRINKYGGKQRVNAAGELVGERQDTRRSAEDFERSIDRSDKAFQRSLNHADISYKKSLTRMEEAFTISKDRSIENIENYGRTVSGTLQEIMSETTTILMDDLGIKATEFHTRLLNMLNTPGAGDESEPEYPYNDTDPGSVPTPQNPQNAQPAGTYQAGDVWVQKGMNADGSIGNTWMYMTPSGKIVQLPSDWPSWKAFKQQEELKKKKYLSAGGIATGRIDATIGEAGNEAVIPLNRSGGQFLGKIYGDITMEMMKSMRTSGYNSAVEYRGAGGNTVINKNTQFMGPITVQAQDPNEMARKLEGKKRLANMRKGANASI
jgi:TP901 family phage tail tape measure protein